MDNTKKYCNIYSCITSYVKRSCSIKKNIGKHVKRIILKKHELKMIRKYIIINL